MSNGCRTCTELHMTHLDRRHPLLFATLAAFAASVLAALFVVDAASAATTTTTTPAPTTAKPRPIKTKGDPVLVAIARAKQAKGITYPESVSLARTWTASAFAARHARTSQRARAIADVRLLTMNLARRGQLTAERLEPALLSVKATTWKMSSRTPFPAHEERVHMPGELATFKYYSGRGLQYQPFETMKDGMAFINVPVPDVVNGRAYADRLLQLSVHRGRTLAWEYYFPFGGPAAPWTSSISQALATDFFARIASMVPEADRAPYADAALGASRSFTTSPLLGGVTVPEGTGSWFLIYPFAPAQRVLNADLQVLISMSSYNKLFPSPTTQAIIDRGLAGVLPVLSKFDTGAWSNYQYGQEANLNYHDFMTDEFKKLMRDPAFDAVPQFEEYYDKFSTYRETPPQVTVPEQVWPTLIPPTDGFHDTVDIRYSVDKRSSDVVRISDADGALVRSFSTGGGSGARTVTWDGLTSAGQPAAAGAYTVQVSTRDIVGNYRRGDLTQQVQVVRDVDAPQLHSVVLRSTGARSTTMTIRALDASSGYLTASVRLGSSTIGTVRILRGRAAVLRLSRPVAQVRTATIRLVDTSGNVTVQPVT